MRPRLDEHERMLLQSLIIGVAFWGLMLSLVFLSGCTPTVKHDVSSSSVDRVVDRIAALDKPVQCRKIVLPPVPEDVELDIFGDKIDANAGGQQLLRGYVACRSIYRDAPGTTAP